MSQTNAREQTIRDRVAQFVAATADGDHVRAQMLRNEVAELCYDDVSRAAARLFSHTPDTRDDVMSIANLVFFETLPAIMAAFDPEKVPVRRDGSCGTFAGWILRVGTRWHRAVGKELGLAEEQPSRNVADQRMLRVYHGCREGFLLEQGRPWTPEEAVEVVGAYLESETTERVLRRQPDLSADELAEAVYLRIRKDGNHRALRQLADLVRAEQSARTLSLDAPVTDDGSVTLADTVGGVEDENIFMFEDLEDWAKVAVLGMPRPEARVAARQLAGAVAGDRLDAGVVRRTRENMVNPLAQYAVLGGVEAQFEPEVVQVRTRVAEARELLVAAANLR